MNPSQLFLLALNLKVIYCQKGAVEDTLDKETKEDSIDKLLNDEESKSCNLTSHVCKPSGLSVISTLMNISSVTQCQSSCSQHPDCKFSTWTNFRAVATCHLLSHCTDKVWYDFEMMSNDDVVKAPPCTSSDLCVSSTPQCLSPSSGSESNKCKKLIIAKDQQLQALWSCDQANPYKDDVPSGTTCEISCPSWQNKNGSHFLASSECQSDGTWSKPRSVPPGEPSFPATLPSPGDVVSCSCPPLLLTYNPNTEPNTQFDCDGNVDLSSLPATLTPTVKCYLLCDTMLVDIIQCRDGSWSGNPSKGFWCGNNLGPVSFQTLGNISNSKEGEDQKALKKNSSDRALEESTLKQDVQTDSDDDDETDDIDNPQDKEPEDTKTATVKKDENSTDKQDEPEPLTTTEKPKPVFRH